MASPKSVQPSIAAHAPELMKSLCLKLKKGPFHYWLWLEREKLLQGKSVVVIGPGISRNRETAEFVRDLVQRVFCRHGD